MTFATLPTLALFSMLAGTPTPTADVKPDVRADSTKPKQDGGTWLTPLDQSETDADVKVTQRIRQQMMKDERLSFTAKNVKIITRGAAVTLRGEVATQSERDLVRAIAANVAGVAQVNDQLGLASAQKTTSSN